MATLKEQLIVLEKQLLALQTEVSLRTRIAQLTKDCKTLEDELLILNPPPAPEPEPEPVRVEPASLYTEEMVLDLQPPPPAKKSKKRL